MKNLSPYFSLNPLDRLEYTRGDKSKVSELLQSNNSLFLIFDGTDIFISKDKNRCFFKKEILDKYNINKDEIVLLGSFENINYFAFTLKSEVKENLIKISLREFVSLDILEESILGVLSQACSLLNWHQSHQYCSFCGELTNMVHVGSKRECLVCKKEHFPRTDPAVIMLVSYEDYCLLGRGINFKERRYSCLAGYVEAGESFEAAAKREVFEEAGVECYDVEYVASQPWPFPSTIMIGMRMKAKSKELNVDKNEIADAIWVHKNDVKAVLEGSEDYPFTFPAKFAIARDLLQMWVDE